MSARRHNVGCASVIEHVSGGVNVVVLPEKGGVVMATLRLTEAADLRDALTAALKEATA